MPFTEEFRNVLRRSKRKNDIDCAFENAVEEANEIGIEVFRDRKKRNSGFKRQKGTEMDFPNII